MNDYLIFLPLINHELPIELLLKNIFHLAQRPLLYELQIRAFSTVSGIVILTESGALHSFNENFIEALIGKKQKESLKDITVRFIAFILITKNFQLC